LPFEKELVESAVRRLAKVAQFIVDVEKDALVVYTCESGDAERFKELGNMMGLTASRMQNAIQDMICFSLYDKMMRFRLADAENRLFDVCRWCFSGSINDWIYVNGSQPLADLAEKYAGHLGRESFLK
jgi:hypothetical protein